MDPANLGEPRALWDVFVALSRIPRASGKETAAQAWIAEYARGLGCDVATDAVGNLRLRAPATPGMEGRPSVALQAHVDMVCEQNEGTGHDFARDPIRLRRDGDELRATGTTLGADDGIGVAAALAVIADPRVAHGPVEVLITVDEETGLTGATELQPGWLESGLLLNLDSEALGELTIGCAGGIDTVATRRFTRDAPPSGARPARLRVSGLKGGHSGGDIHLGRGNAIRVLAQVLDALALPVADLRGGNKRNALAREASAVVWVSGDVALGPLQRDLRGAFGDIEPGLTLSLEPLSDAPPPLSRADRDAIVGLLLVAPHGVEAMSPAIPGLVQTSTNLGVLTTSGDGVVEVNFMSRSDHDPSKRALMARISAACALAGFEARHHGDYPGWSPAPDAPLVRLVNGVHVDLFGAPLLVRAIHAGLECGLIGEKHPGMQMVSFGPDVHDAHTPDEHVHIASVDVFWRLLTGVLARVQP